MATSKATKKTAKKKVATAKKAAPKKAAAKKATKKTTSAKSATKKKSTIKAKTTTKKATTKKVTATKKKATAKKAATAKATVSKTAKKSAPKKATTKKAATKKTATKKAAPTKKATTKKAPAKKATTKKVAAKKAAPKKAAEKAPAPEAESAPSSKAEDAKPAAKKATKKATKKTTTKRASRKKAPAPRPIIDKETLGKVGQAPRRTANEVAASNPFPVPPQIHESVEEAPETPSAESKAAKKEFKVNDKIVYPAHGVGIIEAIERQEIVGTTIEVFVIRFEHEKLRLRVPTEKAKAVGMRELSDNAFVDKTIVVLQGRARVKRTMWSRRAQEYEAKINSGDLNAVAEVVRDLYRAPEQPEQSYSERQLFEAALDRMAREVAAVKNVDLSEAIDQLDESLKKKQIAA